MPSPNDATFRDAEDWLAERGIERDPIRVPTQPAPDEDHRTPVSPREAARLATEAASLPHQQPEVADLAQQRADAGDIPPPDETTGDLQEEVAKAVAYARRSTAQAPKSEGRLRERLVEREYPDVVIRLALERCRAEGLVDDPAMAAALIEERRAKGHAPFRIRRDLEQRGFERPLLDRLLAPYEAEDPEAQAFEVATRKAARLSHVDAETAFRRTAGFVARRGYPESLARKVAREAVFSARDAERTAGH